VSLSDPDHILPGPGVPQPRPLLTTSVVIYVTLLVLAVTIPRGLVNWAKGLEPNPAQATLLRIAEAMASVSHEVGTDWAFDRGRELFLRVTGKRED